MLGPPSGAAPRTAKRVGQEACEKMRLELIFSLDLFGSFSIKGKGTKKTPVRAMGRKKKKK